jgi:hypothetical protein
MHRSQHPRLDNVQKRVAPEVSSWIPQELYMPEIFPHCFAEDQTKMLSKLIGVDSELPFPKAITSSGGGGKFTADGAPLIFPGNTFLCHIDPASEFNQALREVLDRLKLLPQANHFTFLPESSLHMTIFGGVCGSPLGEDGWPKGFSRDATLSHITGRYRDLFTGMQGTQRFGLKPVGIYAPAKIIMTPTTPEDAQSLRAMRHKLQELTGIYRPDIDSYRFHVSLAYLVRWLSRDDAIRYSKTTDAIFQECLGDIKSVDLGSVEFCEFETMHHFRQICRS